MRFVLPVATLLALLIAGVSWVSDATRAAPTSFGEARVQLFSGGKVVGEWAAAGPGRMEGGTFVFPVRKGVQEVEVRIRGTFSFEQQP